MRASQSSIMTLKRFAKWNNHFVVIPPRRFVVFGEGKDGALRGIAAEGYINEDFDAPCAFTCDDMLQGRYSNAITQFNPARKVEFFDELIDAPSIASFTLGVHEHKLLCCLDARRLTHIRFYKKPSGKTTARAFDVRKYYTNVIASHEVDDFAEVEMKTEAEADFHFYIELKVFKHLPKDEYQVTVLDNEMVTFEGRELGLTFHMRDQRLGEQMEERVLDLGTYDELLFMNEERVRPSKNNWKAPVVQRR